jgi:hypothetical protein
MKWRGGEGEVLANEIESFNLTAFPCFLFSFVYQSQNAFAQENILIQFEVGNVYSQNEVGN